MNKKDLALRWLTAFNSKNLTAIMACYHPTIEHTSPKIGRYFPNYGNTIKGKTMVEEYFTKALANNPNLYFNLQHVLEGVRSVVLVYQRMENDLAGEFLEFNEEGLIIKSCSHYRK